MSGGKKVTTHCHFGGGLNSSSGGELKLYLKWKRNTLLLISVIQLKPVKTMLKTHLSIQILFTIEAAGQSIQFLHQSNQTDASNISASGITYCRSPLVSYFFFFVKEFFTVS